MAIPLEASDVPDPPLVRGHSLRRLQLYIRSPAAAYTACSLLVPCIYESIYEPHGTAAHKVSNPTESDSMADQHEYEFKDAALSHIGKC